MKMSGIAIWVLIFSAICFSVNAYLSEDKEIIVVKKGLNGKKALCRQGWECDVPSSFCCNKTISDLFEIDQFEKLFPNRNAPVAFANSFWDYRSFITASALFQPLGFGTTGNQTMQMMEVAAFLAHVGAGTTCGYGVATGGPLAWGLCYKREMSPSSEYCDDFFKFQYPCSPGAAYYGRGAIPIYWNYNYGKIGESIKSDLLNHPEYIEQNATLAFHAAIHQWMTPPKRTIPSAHEAFVGTWKPTKNDTLSKRTKGFGTTMNVLYGDRICGQGDIDPMNVYMSHFSHYLDVMGLNAEMAGTNEQLGCAHQVPFTISPKTTTSSSS